MYSTHKMLLSPSAIFSNCFLYDYSKFKSDYMHIFCAFFFLLWITFWRWCFTLLKHLEMVEIALIYLDNQLCNVEHMLSQLTFSSLLCHIPAALA